MQLRIINLSGNLIDMKTWGFFLKMHQTFSGYTMLEEFENPKTTGHFGFVVREITFLSCRHRYKLRFQNVLLRLEERFRKVHFRDGLLLLTVWPNRTKKAAFSDSSDVFKISGPERGFACSSENLIS